MGRRDRSVSIEDKVEGYDDKATMFLKIPT
jgi:hypothetical protein